MGRTQGGHSTVDVHHGSYVGMVLVTLFGGKFFLSADCNLRSTGAKMHFFKREEESEEWGMALVYIAAARGGVPVGSE